MKQKLLQVKDFSQNSKIAFLLASEIVVGVFLTLFALGGFLKLGDDVLEREVFSFDSSIIHFFYTFRNPIMTFVMKDISFLGGEIFLGIAIISTILLLLKKYKKDALIFSFILFFGLGLNLLLKDMFQRPRPHYLPLVHETSFSFPSGHAMNSFVFYMCLSYFIFRNTRNKKLGIILITVSSILVILIGMSRIYLGAHYPSDVIAGYLAGLFWFGSVIIFEKSLVFFRLFKEHDFEKHS